MSGLWSGPPVDSVAEEAAGLDLIPTSSGRANAALFGQGLADNPFTRFVRNSDPSGILGLDEVGEAPPSPMEPSEVAAKFPGLKVTQPVTESMAEALYRAHREQELRANIMARAEDSVLTSAPARLAVSLAAGLLDPLNVAAGLVPVFGTARTAGMLARAGGALGRAGVRAGVGAAEGAVGMAALEPLQYGLDRFEGNDWTMGEAMHRIAMGAAIGSVLHTAGGGIKDAITGEYRAGSRGAAVLERLERLDPEDRKATFDASVAAVAEGRPVDVAPLVDMAEARASRPTRDGRVPSLLEFLASRGGVRDDGGELRAMDLDRWHTEVPFRPRLVRDAAEDAGAALPGMGGGKPAGPGMSLDDAALAAWQEGYLGPRPARGAESVARPDINALLEAMGREARGERVLPEGAVDRAAERRAAMRNADIQEEVVGAREEAHATADAMEIRLSPDEADHAARLMVLDRLGAEEAIMEARRATELDDMEAVDRALRAREAARGVRDIAARTGEGAEPAAERAAAETIARAPRAEGPVDAQAAELARLFDETRAIVEAEVKAGRLTEGDLATLREAELMAANLEGDARAYQEAAACLIGTGGF